MLAPSELGAPEQIEVAELLRSTAPSAGTLRGRVLHEWLAGIEWLEETQGAWDEADLLRAARRVDPSASEPRLRSLLGELRRYLAAEPLRAILSRPLRDAGEPLEAEVWRERPFVAEREGRLLRGVFDRVVLHSRRGVLVAAELYEWKTEPPGEEPRPEKAAELEARHRAQLEAYRAALAVMLGVLPSSVSARIIYLSTSGTSGSTDGRGSEDTTGSAGSASPSAAG
jgi:ATP-dependent exoDNAse (exonuclease V) beta subunit